MPVRLCKIPQTTGITDDTVTEVLEDVCTVACSKGESIAFKSSRMDISSDASGINPLGVFSSTLAMATFVIKILSNIL